MHRLAVVISVVALRARPRGSCRRRDRAERRPHVRARAAPRPLASAPAPLRCRAARHLDQHRRHAAGHRRHRRRRRVARHRGHGAPGGDRPESGVAATYYSVDAGAWTQGDTVVIAAPKDHSDDGAHTIAFYSVDDAGIQEAPQSVTVKIDTTPPGFTWRGVSPSIVTTMRSVDFQLHRAASPPAPCSITGVMTDQYGYRASALAAVSRDPGARQVTMVPRHAESHRPSRPASTGSR